MVRVTIEVEVKAVTEVEEEVVKIIIVLEEVVMIIGSKNPIKEAVKIKFKDKEDLKGSVSIAVYMIIEFQNAETKMVEIIKYMLLKIISTLVA